MVSNMILNRGAFIENFTHAHEELGEGQMFQDQRGRIVKIDKIDMMDRVHWTSIPEDHIHIIGVMSMEAFETRFSTRVEA